jgi:hypothetical protein
VKSVYTENHRGHDPQFFLVRGVNFDDLSDAERGTLGSLMMRDKLSCKEVCGLHELQDRQWLGILPTSEAAEALMRDLSPF